MSKDEILDFLEKLEDYTSVYASARPESSEEKTACIVKYIAHWLYELVSQTEFKHEPKIEVPKILTT